MGLENFSEVFEGIQSSKWLEKCNAMKFLRDHAENILQDSSGKFSEACVVFLRHYTKEFKDSNVNVLKSAFETISVFSKCAEDPQTHACRQPV